MNHPLTKYREAKNITLEQFGERFGVNKSTVLRWEEGRIPAERLTPISKATGIPVEQLLPSSRGAAA